MITTIDATTVEVTPGEPDPKLVVEYAELLIDTEGWNSRTNDEESSREVGWTLHDSIGEANRRLFGGTRAEGSSGGKDGVRIPSSNETTRVAATALVEKVAGKDDKKVNDKAKSVDEIFAVLRAARGAA